MRLSAGPEPLLTHITSYICLKIIFFLKADVVAASQGLIFKDFFFKGFSANISLPQTDSGMFCLLNDTLGDSWLFNVL